MTEDTDNLLRQMAKSIVSARVLDETTIYQTLKAAYTIGRVDEGQKQTQEFLKFEAGKGRK